MKKYLLILWLLVCAPFAVFSQADPGYYVPLTDLSGIDTTQYHSTLEIETRDIVLSMPDILLHNHFRVYDFGFYIHSEVAAGGVSSSWTQAFNTVSQGTLSDYFILFGRESDSSGINKRIRVELRLPNTQSYSCLDESYLQRLLEEVANENISSGYVKAEIEALKFLRDYIYKVVVCNCAITGPNCSQFSGFRFIDLQLRGLGFRKKQIELGAPASWPDSTLGIYDYAQVKVIIDGEEFYIPEEVAESKAIFDSPTQVLADTIVNTSVKGKVYILDNESFTNGEWENAVNQSLVQDYVEYWVVLTDDEGNTFLYSKYTLGALEDVPAARDENGEAGRPSVTLSPWGSALKVLGNAAVDVCMQSIVIRIAEDNINDWSTAWKKVDYVGALWEGISSLIPWKKKFSHTILQSAGQAFAIVLDNAFKKPDYTVQQGVRDFAINFGNIALFQLLVPKIDHFGANIIFKGLSRLDKYTNNSALNKIIKVTWNSIAKSLGTAVPLSDLFNSFSSIIGNTGLKHIFRGEIKNGISFGVHHISAIRDGSARIIPSSIKDLGGGFYEASVEVLDKSTGKWILKEGKSTFFPDNWSETKVMQEIEHACKSSSWVEDVVKNSGIHTFKGKMTNGKLLRITRYPNFNNNVYTAFLID